MWLKVIRSTYTSINEYNKHKSPEKKIKPNIKGGITNNSKLGLE